MPARRMPVEVPPIWYLAIDPGDRHVGWAKAASVAVGVLDAQSVETGEWNPNEAHVSVREWGLRAIDAGAEMRLVVEEFVLYPGRAKEQAGSDFKTSQLIGALKLIANDLRIEPIMQGATIKNPTRKQLKARGIPQVGGNTHELDAELHLFHHALRSGLSYG